MRTLTVQSATVFVTTTIAAGFAAAQLSGGALGGLADFDQDGMSEILALLATWRPCA